MRIKFHIFKNELAKFRYDYSLIFTGPVETSEGILYNIRTFDGGLVAYLRIKDNKISVYDTTRSKRYYDVICSDIEDLSDKILEVKTKVFQERTLNQYVEESTNALNNYNDRIRRS